MSWLPTPHTGAAMAPATLGLPPLQNNDPQNGKWQQETCLGEPAPTVPPVVAPPLLLKGQQVGMGPLCLPAGGA